jgi:hypothetical protein
MAIECFHRCIGKVPYIGLDIGAFLINTSIKKFFPVGIIGFLMG